MCIMTIFTLLLLVPGLLPLHAMKTESYVLFIIWSVIGLACFGKLISKDIKQEYKQRILVWIIPPVLLS